MTDMLPPSRLLLCEDEGITVMQLRKALERAGYKVVAETSTAEESISLARAHAPDLILMDIALGGTLTGIDAVAAILQERSIPILMISAYSDMEHVRAALEAGACGYIVKPITSAQLVPALEAAISHFRRVEQAREEASALLAGCAVVAASESPESDSPSSSSKS